jgi:hypothetical protein
MPVVHDPDAGPGLCGRLGMLGFWAIMVLSAVLVITIVAFAFLGAFRPFP